MPKLKTRKGVSKRFKITGKGKLKRSHANAGHILTKKSTKQKRGLRKSGLVNNADVPRMKRMLGA
ncbi:MAG: 50S ribosomal protein L35 [Armatimonadetes bacterium]|nr:50S ribosomal protein L35 [Armatimonadota bacterium]